MRVASQSCTCIFDSILERRLLQQPTNLQALMRRTRCLSWGAVPSKMSKIRLCFVEVSRAVWTAEVATIALQCDLCRPAVLASCQTGSVEMNLRLALGERASFASWVATFPVGPTEVEVPGVLLKVVPSCEGHAVPRASSLDCLAVRPALTSARLRYPSFVFELVADLCARRLIGLAAIWIGYAEQRIVRLRETCR